VRRRAPGESWWGLAGEEEPRTFGGSDDELVATAWSIGEIVLWRYSSSVERASPILSTDELGRFLAELFTRTKASLTLNHLAVVLRRRFDLDEPTSVSLGEEEVGVDEEPVRDEEALDGAVIAILADLTERRAEVLYRKWHGASLEAIAAELGISRGTVDNELVRAGEAIDRQTGDFSRDEILEKLLDALS
jgi:DNA-binding CsgD family transcriptional regulator